MRAIFIYDNTGKIYHWAQGDFIAPVGLPYLIIEDYDFEEKRVEKIDTSVNPPVPIYGMTKEELIREGMTLEEYKECRQIENKELLAVFLKENLYFGRMVCTMASHRKIKAKCLPTKLLMNLKNQLERTTGSCSGMA